MIIGKSLTALGGGGLKPEISVTAKAGALLNLHYKDSSIILQSYQLGESETQHTFVVDVSETAYVVEDVSNSLSVEVLVDSVSLFSVKIPYKTYLYKEGAEYTDITGGWKSFVSKTDLYYVNWHTAKKIDVSPYTKICFDIEGKVGPSGDGLPIVAGFSNVSSESSVYIALDTYPRFYGGDNLDRGIVSLDIADVNEELFVVVGSRHNPYYSSGNEVSKGSNYLYIDCNYIYSPGEREYIWLYNAWLEP